jgi:hypothetical protein
VGQLWSGLRSTSPGPTGQRGALFGELSVRHLAVPGQGAPKEPPKAGVPTVPTTWVTPGETFSTLPSREFVVEASVSAGGRGTTRYAPGGTAAVELNGL